MNRRLEERRAEHRQYKKDVAERGKPFFPYSMFHDTVMSLFVVTLIVVIACIWKFTADEGPNQDAASSSGWFGRLYDDKADPGTTSFTPRPDWYFYFLFYLLRIFKWPDSVLLGTVIVPTMALVLLLALPFLDVRRERRPLRRPVAMVAAILTIISMGTLSYKGATAKEPGAGLKDLVPSWAAKEGYKKGSPAYQGALLFATAGCANCHTYNGAGASNLGAPDLSAIGKSSNRGVAGFAQYVADPSKFGNNKMPKFAELGQDNLQKLGAFLQASQGPK
jgi:ubiquinol-cytochrome c reductase cytochrome b subunit/menaquinol-cytochrome c reductase cytochrome b/c subunit